MKMFAHSRVRIAFLCAGLIAVTALFAAFPMTALQGIQRSAPQGYIGGVVRSSAGPEAGVWVIAETKDLATPLIKIVVTDDQGRYMLPELPDANFSVWVRGYGLADSTPVRSKPVTTPLNLTAVIAKTPQEAAKVYPGNYWLTMMEPPAKSMFPGTGEVADNNPKGNGVGNAMVSQENWVHAFKSNCNFCHQLGNPITRTLDHVFTAKPELKTPLEAWDYRLRGGVRGTAMYGSATTMGRSSTLKMLVDWTDRIKKGEVPQITPPRPTGVERNVVLTLWDWGTDHSFMHDEVTTDRNNPRVNAHGPVYAVSAGHGTLVRLDPYTHEATELEIPTREPREKVPSRFPAPNPPSLHWGSQHLWSNPPYNPADPHNPMMDSKGRVWLTSKIRGNPGPAWCSDPTKNKSADYYPLRGGGRQASFFDPKTQQFTVIETCYATHHLYFDTDANETVYFNELSGPIVGWIDTKVWDQTKDEQKAVGWCGQVLDTNGDGKITKPWNVAAGGGRGTTNLYTDGSPDAKPGAPDPTKDTMISYSLYGVMPSPADNSAWGSAERFPGYFVRVERGDNPPYTCRAELFKVPAPGLDPRGIDIDKDGVVWSALAASSHLAAFDRRKCKDLKAVAKSIDGTACPEGWTLYESNSPKFKNADIRTDFHYYNWVDRHNIMGFGENVPIATGSNSDSLLILDTKTRQWTTLRVPYPLGFYSRGLDGRIDDPNTGWKGRALWANYGTHFVWHIEGGKGTKGKMVKFQVRPNPLAR
jgi:hypothetical protein